MDETSFSKSNFNEILTGGFNPEAQVDRESNNEQTIELTPEEMLAISQDITDKFAPGPIQPSQPAHTSPSLLSQHSSEITLSPQELIEISQEITENFAPEPITDETELVLMPVDPYHLYAYWHIAEAAVDNSPSTSVGADEVLRIYWRPEEDTDLSTSKMWFDIPVETHQSMQKIRLPISGTAYSAALGSVVTDNQFNIDAESNIIRVPSDAVPMPKPTISIQPQENENGFLGQQPASEPTFAKGSVEPMTVTRLAPSMATSKKCVTTNGYEAIFFTKINAMLAKTNGGFGKYSNRIPAYSINNASGFGN